MANATLPSIIVAFKSLATSFIERSQRGIAILIVREDGETVGGDYTPVTPSITEATLATDLTAWSNANAARIGDMLAIMPAKVVVVTIDTTADLSAATDLIEENYQNGRVTTVSTISADYSGLATWAKAKKSYHALVFNVASQDSRYVESIYTQSVTFNEDWDSGRVGQGTLNRASGTYTSQELAPLIAAILSRANVNGASSTIIKALSGVVDLATPDTTVNNGYIVLYNDWAGADRVVRLGTAVNTLTTFDNTANDGDQIEDMRYIEISEVADMIRADIKAVFRDSYSGRMKNSVDNQMQLIGAIANYFDALEEEAILSPDYANNVEIDVDAQRAAWVLVNPDAAGWDDDKVRATPYKRNVYLSADVMVLNSMQNLKLEVTLN